MNLIKAALRLFLEEEKVSGRGGGARVASVTWWTDKTLAPAKTNIFETHFSLQNQEHFRR